MKSGFTICAVLVGAMAWRASAQGPGGGQPAGIDDRFFSYDMLDADTGWASADAGNRAVLLQTHDGGKNWQDITPKTAQPEPELGDPMNGEGSLFYHLLDATHGWAAVQQVGNESHWKPALFFTPDGGRTWQRRSFQAPFGTVVSVQFPDTDHGFISVEDDPLGEHVRKAVYTTVDGGKTWQKVSEDSPRVGADYRLPRLGNLRGMVFRNAAEGWINGEPRADEDAFFFHTTDAGRTWKFHSFESPSGFDHNRTEVSTPQFFGEGKNDGVLGVLFRQYDPDRTAFALYRTRDGGENWLQTGLAPEESAAFVSPSFVDADRGWLVSRQNLFATVDGGAHWQKLATNLRFGEEERATQLRFVDAETGWLVKKVANGYLYELLRTADGGRTWTHCCGPRGELAAP